MLFFCFIFTLSYLCTHKKHYEYTRSLFPLCSLGYGLFHHLDSQRCHHPEENLASHSANEFLLRTFQAFMPLIGWAVARRFAHHIEAYDHWLAFGLLAFLGIRMIKEALQPEEKEHHFNPQKIKTQLLLAIATSIDALAVGITFAFIGYRNLSQLALPLAMIGGVSVVLGFTGTLLGIRFGRSINHRLQPELAGGIILCLIGTKILISHLTA